MHTKINLRCPLWLSCALTFAFMALAGCAPAPKLALVPVAAGPVAAQAGAQATVCPQPTPEPFRVDPVQSPTDALTQLISVRVGAGERVTVEVDGVPFVAEGAFDARSAPAQVEVTLQPNAANALKVSAQVRGETNAACTASYVLHTTRDRDGRLLVIDQRESIAVAPTRLPQTVSSGPEPTPEGTRESGGKPAARARVETPVPSVAPPRATRVPPKPTAPAAAAAAAQPTAASPVAAKPTPVAEPVCIALGYGELIAKAPRPAALATAAAGVCVNVRFDDGETVRARWAPQGSSFKPGRVMYMRRGVDSVTVFSKDGVLMAKEFLPKQKAEELTLLNEGGRLLLAASKTPVMQINPDGSYTALVDVLTR